MSFIKRENMGGTVSVLHDDGSVSDTSDYKVQSSVIEPNATGVTSFAEIPNLFINMKNNNITPFLVLHHSSVDVTRTWGGVDGIMHKEWDDSGTGGGWDWSVRHANQGIRASNQAADSNGNYPSDYICVGHTVSWDASAGELVNDALWNPNLKYRRWLFAHKSICYDCPAQSIMTLNNGGVLYNADVNNTPGDAPKMYYPLGFFGKPKNGKCVAVLRAFLYAGPWTGQQFDVWEECCNGPWYFLNQASRTAYNSEAFANTLAVKQGNPSSLSTNYEIRITVDEALNNMLSCVLQKSTQRNRVFQGFTNSNTGLREETNASNFMRALCNSELNLSATDYPDVCSCLGRAGVEDALRAELGDSRIRMICYSQACIDGQSSGNVYTFQASPQCEPINICKPEVNINAVKVSMTGVNFTCGGETTAVPPPPPHPPPPSSDSSGNPPASDSSPAPGAADTNNTGLIIGAAVGGVLLIICIIVIVVVVKNSKPKVSKVPKVLKSIKNK